jgi:hypothetical protein
MKSQNNSKSQEKAIMRYSKLSFQWCISRAQMVFDRITCLKIVRVARASVFRRMRVNDTDCKLSLLHWVDNFECLIMAFSWDLELFYDFIQWHSIRPLLCHGAYCETQVHSSPFHPPNFQRRLQLMTTFARQFLELQYVFVLDSLCFSLSCLVGPQLLH